MKRKPTKKGAKRKAVRRDSPERARVAYLKRMAELDKIAARILGDKATKTTAKAMLVRERREIATHVARVRHVDVDGKLIAPPPPDEQGAESGAPLPGLTIDLSRLSAEQRAEILKQHADKIAEEIAN